VRTFQRAPRNKCEAVAFEQECTLMQDCAFVNRAHATKTCDFLAECLAQTPAQNYDLLVMTPIDVFDVSTALQPGTLYLL
jgi:hypothetical protein